MEALLSYAPLHPSKISQSGGVVAVIAKDGQSLSLQNTNIHIAFPLTFPSNVLNIIQRAIDAKRITYQEKMCLASYFEALIY